MTTLLSFIQAARPFAEFLYFVAGILLLASIVFAYAQVRALKNDIRLRGLRVSQERALEACDRYLNKFLPLANEFFKLRDSRGLGTYSGPIGDFSPGSLGETPSTETMERLKTFAWLAQINELELIAALFFTGVADADVGFGMIGKSFCKNVEEVYDIIAFTRSGGSPEYYNNLVGLYGIWSKRIKVVSLNHTRSEIDSQLESLVVNPIRTLEQRDSSAG